MTEETRLIKPPVPDLSGEGDSASCEPDQTPSDRRLTLTSHSLKIDAGLFSLDLSWRRLEMDPKESPVSPEPVKPAPAPMPSFEEILRRQQIADLLAPVSQPPGDCQLIQSGPETLPPMVPVRLAYPDQDRPLAGMRSLRSSTV